MYAKTKISDCLNRKHNELSEFLNEIKKSGMEKKVKNVNMAFHNVVHRMNKRCEENIEKLKEVKATIDNLIEKENDFFKKSQIQIDTIYNQEINNSLSDFSHGYTDCIFLFNLVNKRCNELHQDWINNFTLGDKVKVIKENLMKELKSEFQKLGSEIDKIEREQSKITMNITENIENLFNEITYLDEINMSKEILTKIGKRISEAKISLNEKRLNRNILPQRSIENYNLIKQSVKYIPYEEPKEPKRQVIESKYLNQNNKFTFSTLFFLNQIEEKSNKFIVYHCKSDYFKDYIISESMFSDKKSFFPSFYRGNKYVNLGEGSLVSGLGNSQKKSYLMVHKDNEEVKIDELPEMMFGRAFHNIIFIPEREIVLVCGGRNNQSAEILNIFLKQEWVPIAQMNKTRSNGCLAYINNKYLYCISGFDGKMYLNDCEFFDLDNFHKDWSYIDFSKINISYNKSVPGVIHLSDNKVMLLGGLTGEVYSNRIHSFVVDEDPEKISLQEELHNVPEETIFLQTNFCFCGKTFVNFDIYMKKFIYDIDKNNVKLV